MTGEDMESPMENEPLLDDSFGDAVSGDIVEAPAPLKQRSPAPVIEAEAENSAVDELMQALTRPFTVSNTKYSYKLCIKLNSC